ncbi:hypothetical protein MIND_00866900 [Mycena indigotica]|uniref:Uncharacterized protein n=1 Tax=Mycena indigotica TaxID=2126181 RepID=A0A8H6SHX3_9AGAR|nr:uncharacterized protein MIND_00866900 [Mycena indigotica]KAF7299182.1 hypothetical protein MIND_00866900 [Mycena indigotica]
MKKLTERTEGETEFTTSVAPKRKIATYLLDDDDDEGEIVEPHDKKQRVSEVGPAAPSSNKIDWVDWGEHDLFGRPGLAGEGAQTAFATALAPADNNSNGRLITPFASSSNHAEVPFASSSQYINPHSSSIVLE